MSNRKHPCASCGAPCGVRAQLCAPCVRARPCATCGGPCGNVAADKCAVCREKDSKHPCADCGDLCAASAARCLPCTARRKLGTRSAEQRRDIASRAAATRRDMGTLQRFHAGSHEARYAPGEMQRRALLRESRLTSEERSARARRGAETRALKRDAAQFDQVVYAWLAQVRAEEWERDAAVADRKMRAWLEAA